MKVAGVTLGRDLLLVAVDGRAPGYSVGASFEEETAIMAPLARRRPSTSTAAARRP
jgi:hypothetical protein